MISTDDLLHERYASTETSRLRAGYYAVKPLLPRRLQLALRRAYAPLQARRSFPAWPIEPVLVQRREAELLRALRESGASRLPLVGEWPEGAAWAAVLTHDVEGPLGIERIERVREVERRHGLVSSWNFVAEWYPIPDGLFDRLRADGCEIGLHGITHDGRLFASRANFEAALPRIREYAERWQVEGFRSPATHRNAAWMAELPVAYDSSFPDTDPYEPQAGGCCSILPFRFGEVVELPITLVQDHTLFEILRERSIERWVSKSAWLMRHRGLINLIVHPDYMDDANLERYDAFLAWLRAQDGGWHALPRDVARWWRAREGLRVEVGAGGEPVILGDAPWRPTLVHAAERDGELVVDG